MTTKETLGMTPREAGERRLKNRVARLARLMELNAPNEIVVNEFLLVQQALWLAYPDDMAKGIRYVEHGQMKVAAGYCKHERCEKAALASEVECAEHLNEPFDDDFEDGPQAPVDVTKN